MPFREKRLVGRAHDTRRCAKRTCCRSGKGRFAACSGRNSTGIFFSLHIYSSLSILAFLLLFVSRTSGLNTTRPTISFWKRAGGRLLPYFCCENAPGALLRNYVMERPGGCLLRSLRQFLLQLLTAPTKREH